MSAQVFAVILADKTTAVIVRVQYHFWFLHSCLFLWDLNSCFNSVLLVFLRFFGGFGSCLDFIAILFFEMWFIFWVHVIQVICSGFLQYCCISTLAFLCLCLLHPCSDFLFSFILNVLVLVLCPFPVLIWRVRVTCNYIFPPVFCLHLCPISHLLSVRTWSLYELSKFSVNPWESLAFLHPWFWILGFLLDFLWLLCPTFCSLHIALLHTVNCNSLSCGSTL